MDLFDPQRDWDGAAWERIRAKVLLFAFRDVRFQTATCWHLRKSCERRSDCQYESIESSHGMTRSGGADNGCGLLKEFLEAGRRATPFAVRRERTGKEADGNVA